MATDMRKVFSLLGASSHAVEEREENDYYATDPIALEMLLEKEKFNNVWECACGNGNLSNVLVKHEIHGRSSDLFDRGYGEIPINFLEQTEPWNGDIVTNPPYKYAEEFVRKAIELSDNKVAMLLRIQFLEGVKRRKLFDEYPPKIMYVFSRRVQCFKNNEKQEHGGAMAYCWFVWKKGYMREPMIRWL